MYNTLKTYQYILILANIKCSTYQYIQILAMDTKTIHTTINTSVIPPQCIPIHTKVQTTNNYIYQYITCKPIVANMHT